MLNFFKKRNPELKTKEDPFISIEECLEPITGTEEAAENLQISASVTHNHKLSKLMTEAQKSDFNITYTHDVLPPINTGDKVWVYNVSRMPFEISSHHSLGDVRIPERKVGEQYAVFTSFPRNMNIPKGNVDTNEIDFTYIDGRRFAMDLINPDNLGIDQSTVARCASSGRDLGEKGVFWSMHNPPLKEETLAAKKRMRNYYKTLLEQVGTKIFTSGMSFNEKVNALVRELKKTPRYETCKTPVIKQEAKDRILRQLNITPEHHAAAEFYGLKTEWHPVLEDKKKVTNRLRR